MIVIKSQKKEKEEPEFSVQKQYEGKFKSNYQKMLVTMNKTLLLKLTTNENDIHK